MARGYRDMRPTVVVDKIGRSSGQLIAVLIAVSAGSAVLLAPLWAVPYVFSAAAGWYWLAPDLAHPGVTYRPSAGRVRPS